MNLTRRAHARSFSSQLVRLTFAFFSLSFSFIFPLIPLALISGIPSLTSICKPAIGIPFAVFPEKTPEIIPLSAFLIKNNCNVQMRNSDRTSSHIYDKSLPHIRKVL